jgi:hypothetical protein
MSEITPEMVGLRPWNEFDNEYNKYYPRRSGRTTRMILNALGYAADGKTVLIFGLNLRQTNYIVNIAMKYAKLLGIDGNKIKSGRFCDNHHENKLLYDYNHIEIFDHLVYR